MAYAWRLRTNSCPYLLVNETVFVRVGGEREKEQDGTGQGRAGHDKAGTGYTQGETMTNWHRTANTRRL